MHDYLQMNDEELLNLVVKRIKEHNPRIKIGVRLNAPAAKVWNGKIVPPTKIIDDVISLDFQIQHYEPPKHLVQVRPMKIYFNELHSLEWSSFTGKWLYPYEAHVPHRNWMMNHQPGDVVQVLDDQFCASPLVLTEEIFKQHEYLLFRFAVSD